VASEFLDVEAMGAHALALLISSPLLASDRRLLSLARSWSPNSNALGAAVVAARLSRIPTMVAIIDAGPSRGQVQQKYDLPCER
jgi:thiamine monophosphate kinase